MLPVGGAQASTVAPEHLRLDVVANGSRAVATHESECPDIGPICEQRDEPPQQHRTELWLYDLRLLGEYGITPNVALQASFGVRGVATTTQFLSLDGALLDLDYENIHHRDELLFSVTDAQLLVHGSRNLFGLRTGLRAGVSVPFGRTEPNPFKLGHHGLSHQHVQFGTGMVDPLLGVDVERNVGPVVLSGFGFVQYPMLENRHGYLAGPRWSGGLVVVPALAKSNFSFRASALFVHEGAERWDGVIPTEDGNQGRSDVYLSPGVTWSFSPDWSASADLRVRVWGYAVNAQLDLPVVVQLSVGRLFHLESDEEEAHGGGEEKHDVELDLEDVVRAGEAVPLEPVPGKVTVFDFWAPWCEACTFLDRELRELAEHGGVALRRVNIVDFDSPIAQQELKGVEVLPHVRVHGPDGQLLFEMSGTPNEILARLRASGVR